jgi:dihydroorotate dehydrogenase electron transfer subunit
MSAPEISTHFADQAVCAAATVTQIERLAANIFRLQFACPEMARRIEPGQFLMARIHGTDDPLIGRPFALFDTDPNFEMVEFVFVVGGRMTRRLAELRPGEQIDVWGPLGNGFSLQSADHVVLVAGGIGYTPFLATAKSYLGARQYGAQRSSDTHIACASHVSFCFGARSAEQLVHLDEFEALGVEVQTSTDDGSAGHHGLITDVLSDVLDASALPTKRILCCGPEPMMEAVTGIAQQQQIPCEVSLETPMACGIGICFTCVARIRDRHGQWDYRRTCVEGPVFDGEEVFFAGDSASG